MTRRSWWPHARQAGASPTLCFVALLLSGCAWLDVFRPIPTITDVRVEQVRLVLDKDVPFEMRRIRPDDAQVFLVTISSGLDLYEFSGTHGTTIAYRISLCKGDAYDPSRVLPTGTLRAANLRTDWESLLQQRPGYVGRPAYFLTMDIQNRGAPSVSRPLHFADHDFRRQNDDVCFYFQGGDGLYGRLHRSLDFRIPYAMIAEALARAGQPHVPLP